LNVGSELNHNFMRGDMLDEAALTELKQIVKSEYGRDLDQTQTEKLGEYLIDLYQVILSPEEIHAIQFSNYGGVGKGDYGPTGSVDITLVSSQS
jgi:hypothetical protein